MHGCDVQCPRRLCTTFTPPRAFSIGFEEEIVPGVVFFTFKDPKIVVKSLFPILYLCRGVVKIWGLLFLGYGIVEIRENGVGNFIFG